MTRAVSQAFWVVLQKEDEILVSEMLIDLEKMKHNCACQVLFFNLE